MDGSLSDCPFASIMLMEVLTEYLNVPFDDINHTRNHIFADR